MSLTCTRCDSTGFLNVHQLPDGFHDDSDDPIGETLKWIEANEGHDVQVCDCCGDGEGWYAVPGEHYNADDPPGRGGPYAGNGGLCRCH